MRENVVKSSLKNDSTEERGGSIGQREKGSCDAGTTNNELWSSDGPPELSHLET